MSQFDDVKLILSKMPYNDIIKIDLQPMTVLILFCQFKVLYNVNQ